MHRDPKALFSRAGTSSAGGGTQDGAGEAACSIPAFLVKEVEVGCGTGTPRFHH